MNPRRLITAEHAVPIFQEAVRERALAVLSIQTEHDWLSLKSRFLECNPSRGFFVLDYQPVDETPLPELVPGQCVGVSFRHHGRKLLFATVVEARGHFLVDEQLSVPAIRYRWPESITELQRRAYYRTPVPESANLLASVWPGGLDARAAAQHSPLETTSGTLVNVSCGGALIRLNELSARAWPENETLGVELQLGDGKPPVLVNARSRGARHDELGQLCIAVQFLGLEVSVDGRLVLQRLASAVQRFHRQSIGTGSRSWSRRHR